MSLKLGTFPVHRLEIGPRTSWDDGTLTIDKERLTESAQATPNVERVTIDIACPGESARIINVNDLMEPRVKVDGPGTAYPGVCNRSLDTVGSGVTYRLGGLGVRRIRYGAKDGQGADQHGRGGAETPAERAAPELH